MPLLTSPIDGSPMTQINRFGIEIDVCPTSGGVWLDKGELEKIMAMIREEAAGEQSNVAPQPQQQQYVQTQNHKHRGHKKESKMSMLMELFDF